MINKVLNYVKAHNMFEERDYVVAGVSGGADSVCLLLMLLEIRRIIPIDIHVVHVNHMIREEAAQDAEYVRQLCDTFGIEFTLVEKDVERLAKSEHISTEEAGRNVRYEAFYRVLGESIHRSKKQNGKIAIAHNKNDCCETFLFNLFRGSSLKGLSGIRPVREQIVRPLMCLERSEIEEYLRQHNTGFCIDRTNLEDNYTRNKIRHHILDTAAREISPAAVTHISEACERINDAYELISIMTEEAYQKCISVNCTDGSYLIKCNEYDRLYPVIQGYLILQVMSEAAGSRKDLESVHVHKVTELMQRQCGRKINLPYNLSAERVYEGIRIQKINKDMIPDIVPEIALSDNDVDVLFRGEVVVYTWNNDKIIEFKLVKVGDNMDINPNIKADIQNIPQKKYTKWFDYDKIDDGIAVRTRKSGDYLTVNSMNQRKTVKSYFVDKKIPRQLRNEICIIADGSHVLWIVGERISNAYKVTESTNTVLQVTVTDK